MPRGKHRLGMPKGKHIFGTQPGDTLLLLGDEESGIVITKPEVVNDLACQVLERVNPSQHLEEEG